MSNLMSNLFWKFAERISAQLVTLTVSVILARLLEPSDYGIIAMVTVFITIANVFVSDSFGSALIQKKDADIVDFCSVLYYNIGFSIVLYLLLFFAAPYITVFYGDGYEILTPVLRVLSIRLIFSAINSVQQAYVSKNMMFKKFFWATLAGTLISAIVGITMAYNGFGVWSLVAQYLTNTTVDTFVLNRTLKLKPKLVFSISRLKRLVPYGAGILGTKLLMTGYQQLRELLIGKFYSSSDLAYYDKGKQFPDIIINNIDSSISAVLFPQMSNQQDQPEMVKMTTRRSMRFSSFVMSPLMLGMAAVANPFIRVVLTDKWLPCVPLMQVFCIAYLFQPIHTANMQAIKAMGRSDIYFKLEAVKKAIELIVLVICLQISVYAIASSMVFFSVIFLAFNAFPNKRLLNYSLKEQLIDISPSISNSILMAVIVLLIGRLSINPFPLLVIQICVGGIIYILLSFITKSKELFYTFELLKKLFSKVHN